MIKKYKEIIIYGNGIVANQFYRIIAQFYSEEKYQIRGYTNSYDTNMGKIWDDCNFILRSDINRNMVDYIVVAIGSIKTYQDVVEYFSPKIEKEKVIFWEDFINLLRKKQIQMQYQDTNDVEMKETLQWLKGHKLTVRNQYENFNERLYKVNYDENGYPYIIYNNYRMYYPIDYVFDNRNNEEWIINPVENDQYDKSPHLYVTDSHIVPYGGIVVDGGAAEGNFTLSYIDRIKKAYLFECETRWVEALKRTFRPFGSKVTIVPKKLGDQDTYDTITLDSAIKEKIDFLKLDVEGAEVNTVLGGMDLLRRSCANLSICVYHRKNDEKYISFILKSLGYRVSTTQGKMFFMYDENIDYSLDFRHGVIYGEKDGTQRGNM